MNFEVTFGGSPKTPKIQVVSLGHFCSPEGPDEAFRRFLFAILDESEKKGKRKTQSKRQSCIPFTQPFCSALTMVTTLAEQQYDVNHRAFERSGSANLSDGDTERDKHRSKAIRQKPAGAALLPIFEA